MPSSQPLAGVPAMSGAAAVAFAGAVWDCCREAVVSGWSSQGGADTDAADPMRSLFLKQAALLFFGPALSSLLKQQHAAESQPAGALPCHRTILLAGRSCEYLQILL